MEKAAYSIDEFCKDHNLGRTTYYQIHKEGRGPTTFMVGRRRLVSHEAAAEWRRQRERDSAAAATGVK